MEYLYQIFLLFCFLAVVLALEGGYLAWNDSRGPEAQRLQRRLRAMSAGEHGAATVQLSKQREAAEINGLERLLLRLPRLPWLERCLLQAGSTQSESHVIMVCLIAALAVFVLSKLFGWPIWVCLALAAAAGFYPIQRLLAARRRRLRRFEEQLPDALDLMGRALRAGHAFSGAIGMVGTESNDPIAGEFRTTFDEINYGIPLNDALLNLVKRVPSTDLRYFVIAILLQRETGGNLAEMLDNLSTLIRARFKLLGTIRALSAEGRLSAWILSLLPVVAAAGLSVINPDLMSILWKDDFGLRLVVAALVMQTLGCIWMWRIIKIRV